MNLLIDNCKVVDDEWIRVDQTASWSEQGRYIFGLEQLRREWGRLRRLDIDLGVELESDREIDHIEVLLPRLSLVALRFDAFADGRAFSQARLLRERYAFRGIIRACGEVFRDQLSFMQRCGFDPFELAAGEEVDSAFAAFAEIKAGYQSGFIQPDGC